jgi:heat shock protein HtpX
MAPQGYVAHAAYNRRVTRWLFAVFLVAFQIIGAFALTMILLIFDEKNTILSNPQGYALRYALPIAALSGLLFWSLYRGHAAAVKRMLDVQVTSRAIEPRFFRIAEEQCIALGVRLPQFGIIESAVPNAVTVGEGPVRGLIAVTRGLLDQLDDDELAAVLAHEASHIRNCDTELLAANHALMRTAVIFQTHNPLRFEDWRQVLLIVLFPPMLLILLASGTATMASMRLARMARRRVRLSRDHIADGEAVRVVQFPEALISALRKIGSNAAFPGSERFEALLFAGRADIEGGHPAVEDRVAAISALGKTLMQPGRLRRDTRAAPARTSFGRRGAQTALAATPALPLSKQPDEAPEKPSLAMLMLFFTDPDRFWKWQNASIDAFEWRDGDERNAFGVTPQMALPLSAAIAFLVVFHWPADGDFSKMAGVFDPKVMVDVAREVNQVSTFCSGPSYPDGKCPDKE